MVGDADASDPAASMAALAVADRGDWLSDVARVVGEGGPAPSDLARWRRTESPELIAAAIDLVRARRSLAPRFPEAAAMLADRAGAAMASDAAAATAKARRIAGVRPRELWDLGCGIGGDSMRLASIDGLERLVLVDLDPARLAMARHNVGLVAPSLPVETIRGDAADLEPGPQSIAAIIERSRHVVLKLGPGTDPDAMPRWPEPSVEYVARGRDLVQAVAWYGRSGGDPPGSRRASIAPDGPSLTGTPDDSLDPTVLGPPPQDVRDWLQRPPAWLLIPHPAAERARLVSAALREAGGPVAGMAPLAAGLGIIASPIDPGSPWLEAIPIREAMPWRAPRVRRRLAELGTGEVVLRTRGRAIDPDAAVGAVRGAAGPTRTVVVLRLGRERVAFIGDV
jgi:hypothetical protein